MPSRIPADPRTPAEQLRELLAVGRRAGYAFENAWQEALLCIKWPQLTVERLEWKAVLGDGKTHTTPPETLNAWRAGYERQAVPGGAALARLMSALGAVDESRPHPRRLPPTLDDMSRAKSGRTLSERHRAKAA